MYRNKEKHSFVTQKPNEEDGAPVAAEYKTHVAKMNSRRNFKSNK